MSQFPSLPLFTDAYIADTQHLTNEEHGAYLRLLMFAWRSPDCRLADDDTRLMRMLGLTPKRWAAIKPAVMAFWELADGFWTQKRLAREHAFVSEKVEKKRASGAQGGRPKSLKDMDQGKAEGSQQKSEPKAPTPTPTIAANAANPVRDLRTRIVKAFDETRRLSPPPDTNRAAVWLAAGHDPDVVIAVIREVLARKPDVGSLSYFDRPIEEAMARTRHAVSPAQPSERPRPLPSPEVVRRGQLRMAAEHFRGHFSDGWPNEYRPGHPDCVLPDDLIAEARLMVATERGMSVAELGATAH